MGRSQVLFNRRKGRNRGGGSGGRGAAGRTGVAAASSSSEQHQGGQQRTASGAAGRGGGGGGDERRGCIHNSISRDGRDDGITRRRSPSSSTSQYSPTQHPGGSSQQQNFEVDRSMSYSDDPNRESTTDQNSNSLLEMLPSGTATSAGTLDLSFMGAALPAVLRDDLAEQEEETGDEYYYDNNNNDYYNDGYHHHHHDDASRVSEVSHNSLRLSALNATLKRLSLQERFRIPQHLIDTLYADRIPTEVTQPVTADTAAALTTTPNELAAPPRPRLYNRALHPSRLASMSSGGTTTAYDGDDDSDAILRSRRSSDDNDGGSTLPSMGGTTASTRVGDGGKATATPPTTTRDASEAVMVSAHNHLPATTDPNQRVLTVGSPRKPPNSPARTGTTVLTQSPQSENAVI